MTLRVNNGSAASISNAARSSRDAPKFSVSRVSPDYKLPIANAIITTENLEQAVARQTDKGRDAARVAVEMANLLDELA